MRFLQRGDEIVLPLTQHGGPWQGRDHD